MTTLVSWLAAEPLSQWGDYGWGMRPGMMGWGGWGMSWVGQILMAAFWIAVIVGIVFLIRWLILSTRQSGGAGAGQQSGDTALDILRQRYARGEIDRETYDQMRKDLAR